MFFPNLKFVQTITSSFSVTFQSELNSTFKSANSSSVDICVSNKQSELPELFDPRGNRAKNHIHSDLWL